MSYTLEDIIKALHHRQLQQQQQHQQQQSVYRQSPQVCIVPGHRFYPYQSIYAGPSDDDESEDDDYYSKYPAFYNLVEQQLSGRGQQDKQSQGAQTAHVQGGNSGSDDLFELLARVAGAATADDVDASSNNEEKRGRPKSNAEDAKKGEASGKGAESQTPTSTTSSVPKLKKTHSTAQFLDPKPKIELSSRNIRDPSIPYSPHTNLYESHDSYDIVLAIPGASIKNLDIDFHPSTNELIIKGNVPNVSDILGAPLSSSTESVLKVDEIRTGSIERRIKFPNLPKIVDEQIKAKYTNGLLTIKVPKNLETEKEKVKRRVIIEDVPDEGI